MYILYKYMSRYMSEWKLQPLLRLLLAERLPVALDPDQSPLTLAHLQVPV